MDPLSDEALAIVAYDAYRYTLRDSGDRDWIDTCPPWAEYDETEKRPWLNAAHAMRMALAEAAERKMLDWLKQGN